MNQTHVHASHDRREGQEKPRDKAAIRLARIEGQVRGLQRMVEEQRHCPEVLMQIDAVREALRQVGLILLRNHLDECVTPAVLAGDRKVYDELMTIVDRYNH